MEAHCAEDGGNTAERVVVAADTATVKHSNTSQQAVRDGVGGVRVVGVVHCRTAEGRNGVYPPGQTIVLVVAVLGGLFTLAAGGNQSAQRVPGIGGGLVGDRVVDAVQSTVAGVGVGQDAFVA